MSASLLIDGPGLWAYHIELKKHMKIPIGRAHANEIHISDSKVSAKHAVIFHADGSWRIRDLHSSNGTFVNGLRIEETELVDGDQVKVGRAEIMFRDPSTRSAEDVWGRTVLELEKHERVLRGMVSKSSQEESAVVVPELELGAGTQTDKGATRGATSTEKEESAWENAPDDMEELSFDAEQYETPPSPKDTRPEDMLWVAEKLADILGELATLKGKTKSELYRAVLSRLRTEIDADNGFIMIPNSEEKRWVIRAWVGDEERWTSYERHNPVPLTIANKAYKGDRLVSNAMDSDSLPTASVSMMRLQVQYYIALPLHRKGKKAGLLYFDVRRPLKRFLPRDVKLLERVGGYLLEIDHRVK